MYHHAVRAVRHSQRGARIVRDAPGTGKATAPADSSSVTGGSMPTSLAIARHCWAQSWRRSPFRDRRAAQNGSAIGTLAPKRQRSDPKVPHRRSYRRAIGEGRSPASRRRGTLEPCARGQRPSVRKRATRSSNESVAHPPHVAHRLLSSTMRLCLMDAGSAPVSARWSAVSATTPRAAARLLRRSCAAPRRAGRSGLVACGGRRRGRRGSSRCR